LYTKFLGEFMTDICIGVSPANHISRYGDRFTPEDVAASLSDIQAMGFSSFQLEVFHPDTLSTWIKRGAGQVAAATEHRGIHPSQLAGHFLLHGFGSIEELQSEFGIQEMRSCLKILRCFPYCPVITVVLPGFRVPPYGLGSDSYRQIWNLFVEKIRTMVHIAGEEDKKVALEILPGSIIGGLQGFLRLIAQLGDSALGYNFDTGHAWVSWELVEMIPGMLGDRVFGTHLKDNDQRENRSLPPGRGTIPWDSLIPNLWNSGYRGSWDLEIHCDASDVVRQYEEGLQFLLSKYPKE
jgi:sugar phosphate isomerase/epimerase